MKSFLKTVGITTSLLSSLIFSQHASAVTVDFTDAIWDPSGSATHTNTLGGIEITVTSTPIGSTTLFWDNTDGLGISSGDDGSLDIDEIDSNGAAPELLQITFDQAVILNNFTVSDFFQTSGVNGAPETGMVLFGTSGSTQLFNSTVVNVNNSDPKETFASTYLQPITGLFFEAGDVDSEFALAGLDISAAPVPVPPALWLFGSAMAFLLRKRQTS